MSEKEQARDLVAEFESSYAGAPPPWDIGAPQPGFAALGAAGRLRGRVLDVGCGTGEHALMAAAAGCEVVGIDIAPSAIALAQAKAHERRLAARFVTGDARELHILGEQFDVVLDCGLFHLFDDDDRRRYVASLAAATRPNGGYFVLCFSDREPPGWGPRRVSEAEIRTAFADGWRVDHIEPSDVYVTIRPEPVAAWLASIVRV